MSFPLKKGSKAPAVAVVQQYLNLTRPSAERLATDGIFGPLTEAALFQSPWKITRVPEPIYLKMRAVVRANRLASLDRQVQERALEVAQLVSLAKEKGAPVDSIEARLATIGAAWSDRQRRLASYKAEGKISYQPALTQKAQALWNWFRVRAGLGVSGWMDDLYLKAGAGLILGPSAALIPSSWITKASTDAETALAQLEGLEAEARGFMDNLALTTQGVGKTIMWGAILILGLQASRFLPQPAR